MARLSLWAVLIILVTVLSVSSSASGQDATPTPKPISDDAVNAVSRNLYCPVCQNTPLEICPTEACIRWREQVRELLAQGYTEEQVRQYFIDHFGMRTVGTPTDPTSRLLTIFLPLGLIGIVGLIAVFGVVRRRRSTPDDAEALEDTLHGANDAEDALTDNYRAKLEDELEEHL